MPHVNQCKLDWPSRWCSGTEMSTAKVLRLDSKSRNLEEDIKATTCRFDVGIVFKLSLAGKSLPGVPNLASCINLVELDLHNNSITT